MLSERPEQGYRRTVLQSVVAPTVRKTSSGYGREMPEKFRAAGEAARYLRVTETSPSRRDAARSELLFDALLGSPRAAQESPRATARAKDVWRASVVRSQGVGDVARAAAKARAAWREALADVEDEPAWNDRGRDFAMSRGVHANAGGFGDDDDDDNDDDDDDESDGDDSYDEAEDWWRRHNAGETVKPPRAARAAAAAPGPSLPSIRSPRAARGASGGAHQIPAPRNRPKVADAERVRGAATDARWEGPDPSPPPISAKAGAPPPRRSAPGVAPGRAGVRRKSTLYDVLGVKARADRGDVKRAYVNLALRLHPDKNPSAEANAQFLRVKEAYATLHNAETRRAYDRSLSLR